MSRRATEFLLWGGALMVFPLILATNELLEDYRDGISLVYWRPFLTEYSSAIVALLLVPGVLYLDRRFPIASKNWFWRVLFHLPLSVLFSILHIIGMFAIRKFVYELMGEDFSMDSLQWVFLYEYRKDLGTYITFVAALYAYREILRLRLGEAQLVRQENKKKGENQGDKEEQILVNKRGVYHFIQPEEVHWVEAAGNYVELHLAEETYMLRSTMKEIANRLGSNNFVRIHRSTLVNRSQVDSIVVSQGGDRKLRLISHDETFNISRNYGQNLSLKA
jgi:hypothetical protein